MRVDEGGRILKSPSGDFVQGCESSCLANIAVLKPYMVRQREMKSLCLPDLESLKPEFIALHTFRASMRVKQSKKPKALMEATAELVQGNAHLDSKAFKRLLSYARHRFLRGKDSRETCMQCLWFEQLPCSQQLS